MQKRLLVMGMLMGFVLSVLMASGAFAQKDQISFEAPMGIVQRMP